MNGRLYDQISKSLTGDVLWMPNQSVSPMHLSITLTCLELGLDKTLVIMVSCETVLFPHIFRYSGPCIELV
jgi:hypothetical protein